MSPYPLQSGGVQAGQSRLALPFLAAAPPRPHKRRMQIMLNGAPYPLSPATSVSGLLAAIGLDLRKVAVERNEEIVPRSLYGETWLNDGDQIEIVHFIGGG
jgi:hypothetical protein